MTRPRRRKRDLAGCSFPQCPDTRDHTCILFNDFQGQVQGVLAFVAGGVGRGERRPRKKKRPKEQHSPPAHPARSPDALDTARGVCDQWLSGLNPRPSQDSVERALERLYRRGLLARETHNGAEPLWSAPNPAGGSEA